MSELEDMAKKYSKKWGVSEEEAEKNIKKFLEKKPTRKGRGEVPSMENLFPEPAGPISEKLQDINQAALSTAFTRKSLIEMNQPPGELDDIKRRQESVESLVNSTMEFVNTTMKEMQSTLEAKQEDERRRQLLEELDSKVITPLRQDLEGIKEDLKTVRETKEVQEKPVEEGLSTLKEKINKAEADAKSVLKDLGYPVPEEKEVVKVPVSESKTPPKDEELVEELKKRGYRVEYDMVRKEDVAKMIEEATKKVQEEVIDDRRITAVENIVRDAISNIFDMFKEPIQRMMESSMEARETVPGGARPSRPKEQSASPEG